MPRNRLALWAGENLALIQNGKLYKNISPMCRRSRRRNRLYRQQHNWKRNVTFSRYIAANKHVALPLTQVSSIRLDLHSSALSSVVANDSVSWHRGVAQIHTSDFCAFFALFFQSLFLFKYNSNNDKKQFTHVLYLKLENVRRHTHSTRNAAFGVLAVIKICTHISTSSALCANMRF